MPVDPALVSLLEAINVADGPITAGMSPAEFRELFRSMAAIDGEPVAVASVADRTVPGPAGEIPVRVVVPEVAGGGTPTGVLVWFHGGGWVIGDLDTSESAARRLAALAGCVVVSVDYRLAPEDPAPAGLADCWAATTWVADHRDELGVPGGPMAVGGDSAGGNLAALVALRAAGEGRPTLAHQLLVYPATDLTMSCPSITENGEGYFLTRETMGWFTGHHLSGGADPADPGVSPLFASDDALAGVAPALVIVAGFDPLRDEGRAYGEKLAAAGISAQVVEYPTMIHGFFQMAGVTPLAIEAATVAAEALRAAFAR